jgi:hypothetical protein
MHSHIPDRRYSKPMKGLVQYFVHSCKWIIQHKLPLRVEISYIFYYKILQWRPGEIFFVKNNVKILRSFSAFSSFPQVITLDVLNFLFYNWFNGDVNISVYVASNFGRIDGYWIRNYMKCLWPNRRTISEFALRDWRIPRKASGYSVSRQWLELNLFRIKASSTTTTPTLNVLYIITKSINKFRLLFV